MIFNTLMMENIRSYQKDKIEFPSGTSLFEGDVGSGKSTILMAVEFALFGLGNQKGDALLRKGSKKGSVRLDFSVDGKDYQVKRTLTRGKNNSIRQEKGILGVDGKKIQLSPSEIKERILDILNFKEPLNPRAQSVIFRYAVYTPQEEMKFILSQNPDLRLQTLRKAFGIEDYKIATENASSISKIIKDKVNYLSGQISDIDQKRDSLRRFKEKLTTRKTNLSKLIEKRDKIEKLLTGQKKELEELKEIESKLKQIKAEIPHLEKQIKDKEVLSSRYDGEIQNTEEENQQELIPKIEKLEKIEKPTNISLDKLKDKIHQIKETIKKRDGLTANLALLYENKQDIQRKLNDVVNKSIEELEKENKLLKEKIAEHKDLLKSHQNQLQIILKKIYRLEAQKDDTNKKIENLNDLEGECPICGSILDDEHKKNLKSEREKEIRRYNSEINILNQVKSKGDGQIESDDKKTEDLENQLKESDLIIDKYKGLNEIITKINLVKEKINNIDEKLSLNIEESIDLGNFDDYINYLENLLDKLKEYNQAQENLKNIKYQYNKNIGRINENQTNIETLQQEIGVLKDKVSTYTDKVKHMEGIVSKMDELQSIYDDTEKEFRSLNEEIITTRTLIKSLTEDVLTLEDEIKEKERLHKQLDKLKDYHIWLNDYMIPTLSLIEKHVMQNIHLEFDENFKKWFHLLIDDPSKTGRIDEEFTPIIEQDGFQQEISYLSGGEKTSVALAYRLALNNVVQKVSTGMKSNLLIMDEPTDGFSKEQLFKIREILNELKYPQIIIVSHEKELESFANNVFQIEKIDGISQVSRV